MRKSIKLIFISLFLLSNSHVLFSQDIFDKNNSKKYADYLYKSKAFSRAALEYERACFLDSLNWDAHFYLIQSYRKSEQPLKGIEYYNKLKFKLPETQVIKFEHENNICIFNSNPHQFAHKTLSDSISNLVFFKTPSLLLDHDWKASMLYLNEMNYKNDKTLSHYYDFTAEGLKIKYKKPMLAASMSTLVPGLGKVYTGYYKDGIIAFVMTGLSAYQAYRGYKARGPKSGLFLIYTGMTAGLYIGNIYGTIKSARQKNRKLNDVIDKKTKEAFYNWSE